MGLQRYHGRHRVNAKRPQAQGICDRCGFSYQLVDLQYQYEYQGAGLQNTGFLVCPTCIDTPNPQLRAPFIPPDPVPVANPRFENFAQEEQGQGVTPPPPPQATAPEGGQSGIPQGIEIRD